ncbi:hypothetical protein BO94DRAFT_136249 [Aspergillus sclerotioniger CBS 115572]|uniref:Rhodopsin domain-containing protein n=1 Tax=Aspergillus sclerotioniger CBS 115572 TaxID=1450535 RepID=A0A317XB88_9EURO|nr:hypothetical protein BO94DRAFT_136249 [Aspergillus sclerotioniger CBS 115572]PWY95779.1 hypothetical protein BO94DRAFT_136249 [Aspergillus sclerotioniger CBS 115572]
MPEQDYGYLRTISLVTQILCLAMVSAFVALRLLVAVSYKHHINVEDAFCFLSWIFFTAYCILALLFATLGGSKPLPTLTPSQTILIYKIFYVLTVLYVPMVLSAKITLLAILARIFVLRPSQIISVRVVLATTVVYYIIIFFVKVFICTPVSVFWLSPTLETKCLSKSAILLADAIMSVITDLAILLLPLLLMWPLRLSMLKKCKVALMLGAGGLAVGFSLYRLVLVIKEEQELDSTIIYMKILLSGNAEGGFGLICSCIPAIHILLTRLRGKPTSTLESSFASGSGGSSSRRKSSQGRKISGSGSGGSGSGTTATNPINNPGAFFGSMSTTTSPMSPAGRRRSDRLGSGPRMTFGNGDGDVFTSIHDHNHNNHNINTNDGGEEGEGVVEEGEEDDYIDDYHDYTMMFVPRTRSSRFSLELRGEGENSNEGGNEKGDADEDEEGGGWTKMFRKVSWGGKSRRDSGNCG